MQFSRLFSLTLVVLTVVLSVVSAVVPFGADTVNFINSTRAPLEPAKSQDALAGNVTELTIYGTSITQAWQGYFGNVSGTIQLADSNDNVMYNWSLADPEGEVYVTESPTVNWDGTYCWDMTTNINTLESLYNITSNDVDGIDETFNWPDHSEFFVNNIQIPAGACNSTRIFDTTGIGVDANYEEVILEGGNGEIIWTSIIEESSVNGFDGRDHDFEVLVPEDGHGTDTTSRLYYFYVELE